MDKMKYDDSLKNVKVKICGIKNNEDVNLVKTAKPDFTGMVLYYPLSKRNISIDDAKDYVEELKKVNIKTVAVTVKPDINQLKSIEKAGFDYIQIHGQLDEEVYDKVNIGLIRAFNYQGKEDLSDIKKAFEDKKIQYVLVDAGKPGSGTTFSWEELNQTLSDSFKSKLIIAGGLSADNVKAAIEMFRPAVVDVSSGVENEEHTGKSRQKVEEFIKKVKN